MKHVWDVYRELHNNGVFFFEQPLSFSNEGTGAVTIECGGSYGIFVDASRLETQAQEAVTVAHEAGHCMTGATHSLSSPYDLIAKHEIKADKWAIQKLIPKDELDTAVERGLKTSWELSEYFGVTEDFMKKAVCYYANGNLAIDYY